MCNDGSPAGYYYAPGTGDGVNLWLIYLEGACRLSLALPATRLTTWRAPGSMFCWDETSCNLRLSSHPFYMSSLSWGKEFSQGGIFGTGGGPTDGTSPWGTANRVYISAFPCCDMPWLFLTDAPSSRHLQNTCDALWETRRRLLALTQTPSIFPSAVHQRSVEWRRACLSLDVQLCVQGGSHRASNHHLAHYKSQAGRHSWAAHALRRVQRGCHWGDE